MGMGLKLVWGCLVDNPSHLRAEGSGVQDKTYFIVGCSLPEGLSPCWSTASHRNVSPTGEEQMVNIKAVVTKGSATTMNLS